MTMHEEWTDKLSEYLDDELPPGERAAVDAHLAQCAECARTLEELRRVVETARALTPRRPARDLWSGVAERMSAGSPLLAGAAGSPGDPGDPEHGVARVSPFRSRQPWRVSFTLPQLAAASLLLAAVSGGLVWGLRGRPEGVDRGRERVAADVRPGPDSRAAAVPDSPDGSSPAPVVSAVSFADAQYDAAVADLEKALEKGRGRLDKSTITIVEQNLDIIDRAIGQARQALEADPANSYLSGHLVEARRKKLDLLRRATALTETD
jgi:anti-sigma factor RsiW